MVVNWEDWMYDIVLENIGMNVWVLDRWMSDYVMREMNRRW